MMSNANRTVLYIGVTNDIVRRVGQHKMGIGSLFTARYHLTDLLYFERIETIKQAILREKQLKRWHKEWKWNLIKTLNPDLVDLAKEW